VEWPFDYPASVVETDTSVIFCLDGDLTITYCNPAWDRFALDNGGSELCRPAVVGRGFLEYISGPQREFYSRTYSRLLAKTEPWEHEFECSSKDLYRKYHMRVVPIQKQAGLFVVNSLLVERPQQRLPMPPLEDMYRNTNDLIVMCGSCRRTRRKGHGQALWDWVPDFAESFPVRSTHGICALCRELYYPDGD
jgi:hypothetical protein